jgi:hypothetical protein
MRPFITAVGLTFLLCSAVSAQWVNVTNVVFLTNQVKMPASIPAQQKPFSDSDFNECMAITMSDLDPMKTQDDLRIRRFFTGEFRALLTKGLTPEPGGVCPLDADFRFDSQDEPPLIEQVGPAEAVDQRWIKVPVRMRKSDGSHFAKVWVYEREAALMRLCDILTFVPGSERSTSLAKELSKLP